MGVDPIQRARSFVSPLASAADLALAPVTGAIAFARNGRALHAGGMLFRAHVEAAPDSGDLAHLAARLEGPALVRLSSAFRRTPKGADLLGAAIRLVRGTSDEPQDLLFATLKHLYTFPFALMTTNTGDYLANDYFAVTPLEDRELGRVHWRLAGLRAPIAGGDRNTRVLAAVENGQARFSLEIRRGGALSPWHRVAFVVLDQRTEVPAGMLRFSPFHAGLGIRPIGLVNDLRRATYAASARVRGARAERDRVRRLPSAAEEAEAEAAAAEAASAVEEPAFEEEEEEEGIVAIFTEEPEPRSAAPRPRERRRPARRPKSGARRASAPRAAKSGSAKRTSRRSAAPRTTSRRGSTRTRRPAGSRTPRRS